jgi:hypothetical protein
VRSKSNSVRDDNTRPFAPAAANAFAIAYVSQNDVRACLPNSLSRTGENNYFSVGGAAQFPFWIDSGVDIMMQSLNIIHGHDLNISLRLLTMSQ